MTYFANGRVNQDRYTCCRAFPLEHGYDVVGCAVAKRIAPTSSHARGFEAALPVGESRRRIASQRGLGKVRLAERVFGSGVQVSEVAAPSTGDQDLLANPRGMLKQQNPAAATARMDGTESRGAGAHNQNIVVRWGRQIGGRGFS